MCGDVERIPGSPNDLDLLLRKNNNTDICSNTTDILTLSETHIRPTDEISVLNVTGYTFLSLPRKTGSDRA